MKKITLKKHTDNRKKTREDLQIIFILDLGYSVLLLIAFTHGYWDSFFGGIAGGLLFNLLFLKEKYLGKKKKLCLKY